MLDSNINFGSSNHSGCAALIYFVSLFRCGRERSNLLIFSDSSSKANQQCRRWWPFCIKSVDTYAVQGLAKHCWLNKRAKSDLEKALEQRPRLQMIQIHKIEFDKVEISLLSLLLSKSTSSACQQVQSKLKSDQVHEITPQRPWQGRGCSKIKSAGVWDSYLNFLFLKLLDSAIPNFANC